MKNVTDGLDFDNEDDSTASDTRRSLVEFHAVPVATLFAEGGTRDLLARIATEARSLVADVATAEGRETIRANAAWVARHKAALERVGLDYARVVKAAGIAIDAERRNAREFLDALKAEVRTPLTALEDAERERVAAINKDLKEIVAQGEGFDGCNQDTLQARIDVLRDMDMGPRWGNAVDLAISDRIVALNRLTARVAELARLDQARAQDEELRHLQVQQAARDRAAAQTAQAAQRAVEGQLAEAQAQIAQEQRKAALAQAEAQRARDEAERERARAQVGEAEGKTETTTRERQAQVHWEIVADLSILGITEVDARAIIRAIVKGQIPHLEINY